MIKADLHNHLRTSNRFYENDFNKTVDIASERLGPGGIISVVNFTKPKYEAFIGLSGYERTYLGNNKNGLYVPEKDIVIVKGQEVPTRQGHLLVLGTGSGVQLRENRSLIDSVHEAKNNNGILIADHPFYHSGIGPYLDNNKFILSEFDAIEIHNGEAAFGFPIGPIRSGTNKKAYDFFDLVSPMFPRLGALSSSDGHSFYELATSYTEIENIEINGDSSFNDSLRWSIQNTTHESYSVKNDSYMGAIDHILDLITIRALRLDL